MEGEAFKSTQLAQREDGGAVLEHERHGGDVERSVNVDLSYLLENLHRIEWRKARVWNGTVFKYKKSKQARVIQAFLEFWVAGGLQECSCQCSQGLVLDRVDAQPTSMVGSVQDEFFRLGKHVLVQPGLDRAVYF